ncbi:ABC transporter ATP-binding protein [Clostridium septicum]|uniref:ABC transporter ATP-binding protein n=1 Tax=Clostridium septicum TaxID=1504 RepID=A0A9N7PJQ0_CLOSE|nr:ABC transporter ATP-binding protein [Clostridium septicum]AYE35036.1 ABC transporter ATP-binding protein [Clostridium septicum]MDU1312626.1 ABC transporter ATP-binding protein [Clostridium septicum]UEC20314.1 ABC transporter ATP-binding protein [Clostridium septicum]USS01634.1 ABC transporter ATP-binding protein [Clostridium septicum]WLF70205.1 ABC transporter ATP-binding protein [Clostridium septicum]
MLKVVNYSKVYKGNKKAVNNISIEIESGDIFGFIGHNGAGKTTTIKSIVGILNFDEGEIIIDGISIKEEPIKCKKNIAYIPDNPDLYDSLTGIQYLNFISDIYNISKIDRENLIKKYGEAFEITKSLGDLISSYSHGMKQKLAIISALIHRPKLLILDEPFVGLDPKASHTLKEIMKRMCSEGGVIFFSTHVLEVAEKLCNKIAIIKDGAIVASGETKKVIGDNTLENVFMELIENE